MTKKQYELLGLLYDKHGRQFTLGQLYRTRITRRIKSNSNSLTRLIELSLITAIPHDGFWEDTKVAITDKAIKTIERKRKSRAVV